MKDLYLDSLLIKHYMRLLTKHVRLHNQGIKNSIQILCELKKKYFCPLSNSIGKGKGHSCSSWIRGPILGRTTYG